MNPNLVREKIIKLYKNLGWKSIFAKVRFWDAPYEQVEKMIPQKGRILELGCGEGLFSNYLALASPNREITGVEIDVHRVKIAQRGLKNTKFLKADVTLHILPQADVIVMMHLLHHLKSYEAQEDLIKKCFKVLSKHGQLIIVEVEPKFSFKYLVTWATDHFLVPWLFEGRFDSSIFFRKTNEWKRLLEREGFVFKAISAEKSKPFTHIVFVCQKKN